MIFKKKYTVLVDDNYHYMDETQRYRLSSFFTLNAAIKSCQRMVDEFLARAYEPGMSSDDLCKSYALFGEDPFIVGAVEAISFSARTYAEQRCQEICRSDPIDQRTV